MAIVPYLPSGRVKVFPAARRDTKYDVDARIFNEKNIVNMTARLSRIKSFVTSSSEDLLTNKPFTFVLGGYAFEVTSADDILSIFKAEKPDLTAIYAYINLDVGGQTPEIAGQDEAEDASIGSLYKGLQFSYEKVAEWDLYDTIHYLKIFEKNSTDPLDINHVNIPTESFYIFTDQTMQMNIDGGIIPRQTESGL